MTFFLMGLGLNLDSISIESKRILKECDEVFLEAYTIDFPYSFEELNNSLGLKFKILKREQVEDESILRDSKTKNIALMIYGDPFSATTHHQLIISCKKQKIPFEIYHNASVINSIAECGLSLYKFGKICSMPSWKENYKPTSLLNYIRENQSIRAHTLLLVDIGLEFSDALNQLDSALKSEEMRVDQVLVCSSLGTKEKKIHFNSLDELKKIKEVRKPFCFIIPSDMHFVEEEFLSLI